MRFPTPRKKLAIAVVAVAAAIAGMPVSQAHPGGLASAARCDVYPTTVTDPTDPTSTIVEASSKAGNTYNLVLYCDGTVGAGGIWYMTIHPDGSITGVDPDGMPFTAPPDSCDATVQTNTPTTATITCTFVLAGRNIILSATVAVVGAGNNGPLAGEGTIVSDSLQIALGFTCGFTSTDDPSGQVVQDPNTQTGEVDGGPFAVPGASSVTITCTISVGDGVISPDDTAVSQTTAGPVGVLLSPVQYQVGAGVSVWLCTNVSWTYDEISGVVTGGSGSWGGFTDDVDGNPYCDEAISVEP